jgi:hypothetical protein
MRAALLAVLLANAYQPPAAPPNVVVKGVVVDDDGRPVAKATVAGFAWWDDGQGSSFSALADQTTNDRGEFAADWKGVAAGLTVYLRARRGTAFTAAAARVSGKDLEKPIRLRISAKNARAVSGRAVDEDGKPIAGAAVAARHRATAPANWAPLAIKPVAWPEKAAPVSDAAGKFVSERCLDPDGSYQLVVSAKGFLEQETPWKAVGKDGPVAFGDVILKRLRPLEGTVVDGKGEPIAGATVRHHDDRQRATATTGAAGRFRLSSAFSPPGFLFVEKDGFRFHGQRCDRPGGVRIVLTRRDEPATRKMVALPPALPLAKRKALAAKLMEPVFQRVLPKAADDGERRRGLEMLARLDPGRALEELEKRPLKSAWSDGYLRRAAVKALAAADHEEARTVADSIRDPGFRTSSYLDLHDALPAAKKADRLTCLNAALLASQAEEKNDHRVISLGWIGRRLHELGEKDRAAKLLREGEKIARELPEGGWAGYARGAFAEELALIDRPAALALMKDLKDPYEYVRHHGNLAHRLGGADPAEAERILRLAGKEDLGQQYQLDQHALRVCYRMAPADLPRARRIATTIKRGSFKARAYVVMAQALAKARPKEALALLDEAFALLAKQAGTDEDQFTGYWNAAALAGQALPVAEAIDPALVPEFLWRALSFHPARRPVPTVDSAGDRAGEVGSLALTLARYDRGLALALLATAPPSFEGLRSRSANELRAAALADPARAVALAGKYPADTDGDWRRGRTTAALLAEGDEALAKLIDTALAQWHPDDEEL